ncbi:T9SS type A sorting domain-containing protein [Puia dinghuensis]|uniref:Secretion system C-terminal sorting domain-containing protein n=1 Tax=Puia dinghuensis TaxID=1792502 RepID=A0A8J2U7B6_9BACT|nr:T9SS type A sorting domain-containing protein [Puia dinghuensis]GGA83889.1 hypothetical protein GCM10011511_03800 [Puia dinghuensis]
MNRNTASSLKFRLAFAALLLLGACANVNAQTAQASTGATPALLLSFDGQVNNGSASLNWVMENETNSKWFVIERAGEMGGYDSISVIYGINNANTTSYTFTDEHMLSGNNYYRLREVDLEGVVRYSKVITLYKNTTEAVAPKMSLYPNPAATTLNFSVESTTPQEVIVQVYNLAGVVLFTTQQQLSIGINQQTIALSGLKNGNYFLKVINREGSLQMVQPFVKMM